MWLQELNKKIKLLDQVLTNLTNIFKKHWLILSLLLLGAIGYFYFFWMDDDSDQDSPDQNTEQVDQTINYLGNVFKNDRC